jgi:ketosteroid isomerase-like protein
MTDPPDAIADYYAASAAGDLDRLVSCFAPDALVVDEGRSYHGVAEIRAWREALASAFTYTLEITGMEQDDAQTYVVTTHLEGDFPGGVVDLENRFTLDDGRIVGLVI